MSRGLALLDWQAANEVRVRIKVNRNQNPELFKALSEADSKSGLARELMREGFEIRKQELEKQLT